MSIREEVYLLLKQVHNYLGNIDTIWINQFMMATIKSKEYQFKHPCYFSNRAGRSFHDYYLCLLHTKSFWNSNLYLWTLTSSSLFSKYMRKRYSIIYIHSQHSKILISWNSKTTIFLSFSLLIDGGKNIIRRRQPRVPTSVHIRLLTISPLGTIQLSLFAIYAHCRILSWRMQCYHRCVTILTGHHRSWYV